MGVIRDILNLRYWQNDLQNTLVEAKRQKYLKRFSDVGLGGCVMTTEEINSVVNKPPTLTPEDLNSARISKERYYLEIARAVSLRGTCLRRNYGAVIVKSDRIVSTGYNGAPRGRANCCDTLKCVRAEKNVPHGQQYELCRSVHAEQNAVIAAGYELTKGSTLYLAGSDRETGNLIDAPDCCMMCKRIVINAGVEKVIFLNGDGTIRRVDVCSWIKEE